MKACGLIFALLVISACGQSTVGRRHSQFDCGLPVVDVETTIRGRVIVGPHLAPSIEQQLPKGVVVDDGCWELAYGGALQGDFMPTDPKSKTSTTYVFEYKEKHWTLVGTQADSMVINPYGIGDRVN